MAQNKRAEKAAEQLEKNAQAVDNIRAAEALLAKIEGAIQVQTATVAALELELQTLAMRMANDELQQGDKSALDKLGELEAAKTALKLASAALPAAQARLEQAHLDARKNSLARDIAVCRKFGKKRLDAAEAIVTAIGILDEAFVTFHRASRDLAASYATKMPANCLIGADIATAISAELYRIAPRAGLYGGQREPIPLLPGAARNHMAPNQTLLQAVEGANDYLVTVLERGGVQPGSHGDETGKVAIEDMVFPSDSISARAFGHQTSDNHPGQGLTDEFFQAEADQPLREGQLPQSELHFPPDAQVRPDGSEFGLPQKQPGMIFPEPWRPGDPIEE